MPKTKAKTEKIGNLTFTIDVARRLAERCITQQQANGKMTSQECKDWQKQNPL